MKTTAGQISPSRLYPSGPAYDRRRIDVGDGHVLAVEQSGNPHAPAVLVVHGGPGGACSPAMRRYFDPQRWRVVMFDQRGCGASTPSASVEANTTAHLISDIELIRRTLGIDSWVLFGGSWGATLALASAQAHPETVRHLILRGVYLATATELDWFYRGGAARFAPEEWQKFLAPLPDDQRDDPIAAYHRLLFCGDRHIEAASALSWTQWECALASVSPSPTGGRLPPDYARAFARLECHYFTNNCFLEEGQLLANAPRIHHIGADIVQGCVDMVCPPQAAYRLAATLPRATLQLIPGAGHAMSEPGIADALVAVTDRLAADHSIQGGN